MKVHRLEDHQSWGDKIDWWRKPHRSRKHWFRRETFVGEIVGWLPRKPRVGDLFVYRTSSGDDAIYLITRVETSANPIDMFFANVMFLKLEPGRKRSQMPRNTVSEKEAS